MAQVLISYFTVEHLEGNGTNLERHQLEVASMIKYYPFWPQTFEFIMDTARNDMYRQKAGSNPFDGKRVFNFEDTARMSEDINEQFGFFSAAECFSSKDKLMSMDPHGTGRVRL